jgi:hypothetical protein
MVRTKKDLVALIGSLPELDVGLCVDLGDIIRWMAHRERHYHQSGSSPDGSIAGTHPGGYPKSHRYFLVFEPEPFGVAALQAAPHKTAALPLKDRLSAALRAHSGSCLDNDVEFERVLAAVVEAADLRYIADHLTEPDRVSLLDVPGDEDDG